MEPAHEEILEPTDHCKASVPSAGDVVELRRHGTTFRVGAVETVMPDGTGFWLASHGLDPRVYVPSIEHGVEIWIRPEPEEGRALPATSNLTPILS